MTMNPLNMPIMFKIKFKGGLIFSSLIIIQFLYRLEDLPESLFSTRY